MDAPRIDRLRGMIAELGQAPRTPERDALLRAIRDRLVTLDAGDGPPSAWRSRRPDDREVLHRQIGRKP
jgi:hypothetical protein